MKTLTEKEVKKLMSYLFWLEKIAQGEGYDVSERYERAEPVLLKLIPSVLRRP